MEEVATDKAMPKLYEALSKFQSELTVIEKTVEVNAGSYKFSYAPLDTIMKTVYPLLGKNGLAVRHELNEQGIEAVLTHKDGGEIRSGAIQINRTGKMQDIGGAMTYARRYSLTMLLGIASEEDTDAGDLTVEGKKQTAKDAAQNIDITEYVEKLESSTSLAALKRNWTSLPLDAKHNVELQNKKEELKTILEQEAAETEDQTPPEEQDNEEPPE